MVALLIIAVALAAALAAHELGVERLDLPKQSFDAAELPPTRRA